MQKKLGCFWSESIVFVFPQGSLPAPIYVYDQSERPLNCTFGQMNECFSTYKGF